MKKADCLKKISYLKHGFYDASEELLSRKKITMNQVHSADALFISGVPYAPPSVDALVTATPGLTLAVKTADCAPVLLADASSIMVAAVHAGWKGAFQGILENTIMTMVSHGARRSTIRAAIGPHLQLKSFEVSDSMYSLFPSTERHFFKTRDKKLFFDFNGYLKHRLLRAGIRTIESIEDDTFTSNCYFSYRRDPANPGRQYSIIAIKDSHL